MANRNRLRNAIAMTVLAMLVVLTGLWILSICGSTKFCSIPQLNWMWHMTHKEKFGLIGEQLLPGQEYYFEIRPVVLQSDYPQFAPVSAREIEVALAMGIATVRADQKYDRNIYFEKMREPFIGLVDVNQLEIIVNGDYYFSLRDNDELGTRITIDQAIRAFAYVKVTIYLQKVKQAEVVRRTRENRNFYTYWSTTGHIKEATGFNFENGKREDFQQCYAEADGSHTTCPDASRMR